MTEQNTFTPIEAINEYYRLKDKYENEYYEKYVKQIVKSNKSKREKRVEYSKLPKQECINCKRNVGTIFNIIIDKKEDVKNYIIKCGDVQEPCPLDIQITYANRNQFDILIDEGITSIENLKLKIIKEKNNAIFFSKNVVDTFDEITEELKTESNNTGYLIEKNLLKNDNPEKKLLINKMMDEFGKGFILPFKEMVKEYSDTNNELKLNQAVNFYVNEMIPKVKEIQSLKYDVNMVEFDDDTRIYKLIQLPNSIQNNEYYLEGEDKVVKFIKGVRKETNKTRKNREPKTITIQPKKKTNKTKKLKPLLLQEDIEDNQPVVVAEESVVVAEEPVVVAEEPVAVAEEPVVVAEEPVAVAEEPVVVAEEPVVVAEEPELNTK